MAKQVMLKFVDLERQTPQKRGAKVRGRDYAEIYDEFAEPKAREQSSRCSQCGVPYCLAHCPLQNNIPDWLRLTAEGRLEEAYETSQATNNLPEICGRICPQDRLCEGACVIEGSGHGTVTIGAVEKYITDTAWEKGWVKPRIASRKPGQSVAIIGAGPAGMSAADELSAQGYEVTVFDRYDRAGGLMIYGIPGFKLEKDVVTRRVALLEAQGVKFRLGVDIGRDKSFADLRAEFDAVLIATGVYKQRAIAAPGVGQSGIVQALDFLTASNRANLGDDVPEHQDGSLLAKGKDVIVIGGGDTAMDCVRTAVRQGAKSVKCLYRRDRDNMPGSAREVVNAEEEGVQFEWLSLPKSFKGGDAVEVARVVRMTLGQADASGRRSPVELEGSETDIKAGLVITALGFEPEDLNTAFATEFKRTGWNTIIAQADGFATSEDGVFAAGDIVRGASLVVWAIREGREAAAGINRYLTAKRAAVAAE